MWVTAYTDASVVDKQAAWAIWLRCSEGRYVVNGRCPEDIKDSTSAEMYAAFMAVTTAKFMWGDTEGILVNSDCLTVVRGLYPWHRRLRNKTGDVQQQIHNYLREHNLRVRAKHVKRTSGACKIGCADVFEYPSR